MSHRSDHVLQKEEHPEPRTVTGAVSLLKEILERPGAVQKILLEKGRPFRAWRWVEQNDLFEGRPTLDVALQHSEILEYYNEDGSFADVLVHMLQMVESEGHVPVCWVTGYSRRGLLEKWLRVKSRGVVFTGKKLLSIPVERLKSLSEDTLILCAANHSEAEHADIALAIKTSIELRRSYEEDKHEDARRSRNHPERGFDPARAAEAGPGRSLRKAWVPPDFIKNGGWKG